MSMWIRSVQHLKASLACISIEKSSYGDLTTIVSFGRDVSSMKVSPESVVGKFTRKLETADWLWQIEWPQGLELNQCCAAMSFMFPYRSFLYVQFVNDVFFLFTSGWSCMESLRRWRLNGCSLSWFGSSKLEFKGTLPVSGQLRNFLLFFNCCWVRGGVGV